MLQLEDFANTLFIIYIFFWALTITDIAEIVTLIIIEILRIKET